MIDCKSEFFCEHDPRKSIFGLGITGIQSFTSLPLTYHNFLDTTVTLLVYLEWWKLGWRASDIGDLLPATEGRPNYAQFP